MRQNKTHHAGSDVARQGGVRADAVALPFSEARTFFDVPITVAKESLKVFLRMLRSFKTFSTDRNPSGQPKIKDSRPRMAYYSTF